MQGSILMDGVDLLTLGLQEVRGRIAAIPQVRILPFLAYASTTNIEWAEAEQSFSTLHALLCDCAAASL